MPHFDRFDICEAYFAFAADFNVGGWATGRKRPTHRSGRANGDIFTRLARIEFTPRPPLNGRRSLTANGKAIYDRLARREREHILYTVSCDLQQRPEGLRGGLIGSYHRSSAYRVARQYRSAGFTGVTISL